MTAIPFAEWRLMGNACPFLSALNAADNAMRDAVLRAKHSVRAWSAEDFTHLIGRQLGEGVSFALWLPIAAFISHVAEIVGAGAKKQMRFVAAWRVVAAVADLHARRNGAIRIFPREATSCLKAAPPVKLTVSVSRFGANPRPAGIGTATFIGVVVETLRKRPVTRNGKEFTSAFSHRALLHVAALIRAGIALPTRFRPVFTTISSAHAEGVSPWR